MIAKLTGIIDLIEDDSIILDVSGVGYKIFCSSKTLSSIPNIKNSCSLFIESVIREDAFDLYGFSELLEKKWFRLLRKVQGVGAKSALSILSVCTISDLANSLVNQDKSLLLRAEGVGNKIAIRIINELKDKVAKHLSSLSFTSDNKTSEKTKDAISALINLGYKQNDVINTINNIQKKENLSVEELIRNSLVYLSKA